MPPADVRSTLVSGRLISPEGDGVAERLLPIRDSSHPVADGVEGVPQVVESDHKFIGTILLTM